MLYRSLIICAGIGLLASFFLPWLDLIGYQSFISGGDWPNLSRLADYAGDVYLYTGQELAFSGAPTCRGDLQLQLLLFPAAGAGLIFTALGRRKTAALESLLIGGALVIYWFFDPFFGVLPRAMEALGVASWPVIFLIALAVSIAVLKPRKKTVLTIAAIAAFLFGYWFYSFVGLYLQAGHIGLWLASLCALTATIAGLAGRPARSDA